MRTQLLADGVPADAIRTCLDEVEAARVPLAWACDGDLLVLPIHEMEAREQVTALLDLLPEDERAVLTLRYVADLDLAGTAEALGRSKTTVSRLQARALATLRGFLDHSPLGDDATEGVS